MKPPIEMRYMARFLTKRIIHQQSYPTDGAYTNQAESFFLRLRRAEISAHHHISGKYFNFYALEMAWCEDKRRVSNGEQFLEIACASLIHPETKRWSGYWGR